MKHTFIVLLALLLPFAVTASAGSPAQTIQATALNAEPYSDARAVQQLPDKTHLTLMERKGGWYHVRLANGQRGWVRMISVRLGEGSEAPAGGGWSLGGVNALFQSGRANTTTAATTTGVRGLNEGTIQNAVPDPQAVLALAQFAATPDAARQYAAQLKLKPEQVTYLPADAKGGK